MAVTRGPRGPAIVFGTERIAYDPHRGVGRREEHR